MHWKWVYITSPTATISIEKYAVYAEEMFLLFLLTQFKNDSKLSR